MADENDTSIEQEVQDYKPQPNTYQKTKRGAKVLDQWGNLEKRRRLVGMPISDICLPPLTRNTVATYRGLNMDQISRSTGEPVEPITFLIPGTYVFYDKGKADPSDRMVFMKNLSRPEIIFDKQTQKQVVDDSLINFVEFVRGVKRIDPQKEYPLYMFLELHPLNKTNKFRDNSLVPIFERVDLSANRSLAFKQAEQDLAFEAERDIVQINDIDKIVALAVGAGVPVMENGNRRGVTAMKSDLRTWARNNPIKFYSSGGDYKIAFKMNIMDGINWGLIELRNRDFYIDLTDEKLFTHAVGEDPVDAFAEWCLTDPRGKEVYPAIKNMLEYWN